MARGRLRVYLGAAPGVGKTYAMLAEGQRRRARGTDVVIGLVEPHGRRVTAQLAEGLELVPRRPMVYCGHTFTEMDVDAVLARRPQVALVDELAHSNVPGARNDKRWQDVDELLEAGIDVVTTLNIQHLESLNDVVEQITGIKQYETILVAADERDIIRVRTNVRGEDDYLYPLQMGKPAMRALFLSYVRAANRLAVTPVFYNTITSNCTTIVYRMARQIDPGLPWDIRLLLTGYLPEYLYQVGALDRNVPIAELRQRGRITGRARSSKAGDDFSRVIRVGIGEPQGVPDAHL